MDFATLIWFLPVILGFMDARERYDLEDLLKSSFAVSLIVTIVSFITIFLSFLGIGQIPTFMGITGELAIFVLPLLSFIGSMVLYWITIGLVRGIEEVRIRL